MSLRKIREIIEQINVADVVEVSIKKLIPVLPASMSNIETITQADSFPVIADNRNVIIEGHGTYWYNIQNGAKTIKVIYIDRPPKKLLPRVSKRIESLLKRQHVDDVGTDPILNINPVYGFSLNKINDDISEYMSENGFSVKTNDIRGDIFLQHYAGKINGIFKNNILIQPIDGTKIKPSIVDIMNSYDQIICPAFNSLRILRENGVYKPIEVIPNYYEDFSQLGTDTVTWQDINGEKGEVTPTKIGKSTTSAGYFSELTSGTDKYTFYSETTGIKRKNVENILKYYLETFKKDDKVRLIIKLASSSGIYDTLVSMVKEDDPEVIIINSFIDDDDLNDLRLNINCYICLSYMEGFCIPLLNAIVLGKDAIALKSNHSGYMDYVDTSNVYLLPSVEVDIDKGAESILIYERDSKWEEVEDYELFKTAMLDVYNGEYEFSKKDKINDILSRFSKETVMYHYKKLFISTIEGYNNQISSHNWNTQRHVTTFEQKEFFNPIVSDVKFIPMSIYKDLAIVAIKSIAIESIKPENDYFIFNGSFADVNVEGRSSQLEGTFYMRRDAEDKWTFKGEGLKYGESKVESAYIEIHTTDDLTKLSDYEIDKEVYVGGTITIKTDEFSYTYTYVPSNEIKWSKESAYVVFGEYEYQLTQFSDGQAGDDEGNVKIYQNNNIWYLEMKGLIFTNTSESPFGDYINDKDKKVTATLEDRSNKNEDTKEENTKDEGSKEEDKKEDRK